MENQPKEYEIKTFEDLCNTINEENAERLLTDMAKAFRNYVTTMSIVRKSLEKECEGLKNWDIAQFGFVWIDDGEHDLKGVTVETPDFTITATPK